MAKSATPSSSPAPTSTVRRPIRLSSRGDGTPPVTTAPSEFDRALNTLFHPDHLAALVQQLFGPVLAPAALASREGVTVKTYFALPQYETDDELPRMEVNRYSKIVALEVVLGSKGVREWRGLKDQSDWSVRMAKLERRGWF